MGRWQILVAFVVLLAVASAAGAEQQRFDLNGQLESAGNARPVSLRVLCEPDPHGGAMSLELWVPEANTRKDFDYDHFEGPDAAAGDRALSHVSIPRGKHASEMSAAAAGWYSGEDPDTFVFGISQRSHEKGKLATLLEAVRPLDTQLIWVQRGYDDPRRELRATFALDAATIARIHTTVAECLTPHSAKPRPKAST